MSIPVSCSKCKKKYKIDEKFAGKAAKCKACGAVIPIPVMAKPADQGGDLLAALHEAAALEQGIEVTPTTNAAARTDSHRTARPAGEPRARPVTSAAARPAAHPAVQKPDDGVFELATSEDACPGCGKSLPSTAVICVSCGFSRAIGRPVATQVPGRPGQRIRTGGGRSSPASGAQRNSADVRANVPYTHGILNLLDWLTPKISVILFMAIIGFVLVFPFVIFFFLSSSRSIRVDLLVIRTFLKVVGFGMIWGIVIPVTLYGIRLSGRIMKFELPEKPFNRLLAVHLISAIPSFILLRLLLGAAFTGAGLHVSGNSHLLVTLGIAMLETILLYLLVCFPVFLFFFRLKIGEALVAFPLMVVFFVLGIIGSAAAMAGLVQIIRMVYVVSA